MFSSTSNSLVLTPGTRTLTGNARHKSGESCQLAGNGETVPGTPGEQENARTLGRGEDQKLASLAEIAEEECTLLHSCC